MSLWNPLNRAMVMAAGISVLAACYAVAAWGQGTRDLAGKPGKRVPDAPTVSVATLRIPAVAWKHYDKARSAAQRHREAEFESESARALEIAPEFAAMYQLRATVQVSAHQYAAAVASEEAALRCDPGTMWATVVLAGAYNGMHRFDDALLLLDSLRGSQHGREAESWQAIYEQSRAEIGAHRTAAAMYWSARMMQSAPREFADAHLVRANALILAGSLNDAAGELEIYLRSKGPQQHRAEVLALRDAVALQLGPQPAQPERVELASR